MTQHEHDVACSFGSPTCPEFAAPTGALCGPCARKAARARVRAFFGRPGTRRGHTGCAQYYVSGSVAVRCGCPCNRVSDDFRPPTMRLDAFPVEPVERPLAVDPPRELDIDRVVDRLKLSGAITPVHRYGGRLEFWHVLPENLPGLVEAVLRIADDEAREAAL